MLDKQLHVLVSSSADLLAQHFDEDAPSTAAASPGGRQAPAAGGGAGANRKAGMARKKSIAESMLQGVAAFRLEVPVESIATVTTPWAPEKPLRYAERKGTRVLFTEDCQAVLQAGTASIPAAEAPAGLEEAFEAPDHTQVLRVSVVDEAGLFLLTLRSPKLFAKAFFYWACEFLAGAGAGRGDEAGGAEGESFDAILHWLLVRETERQLGQAEADRILGGASSDASAAPRPGAPGEEGADEEGPPLARGIAGAGAKGGKESAHAVETRMLRTAGAAISAARSLHAEPMTQWRFRGSNQNCMCHSRSDGPFNPPIFRGQVTIRAPAHITANYILEPSARARWDHLCQRLAVVHEIDRHHRVERLSELTVLEGHAPNDYFMVTGCKLFPQEKTYVIASRSVGKHPDNEAPIPGFTRAEATLMAFLVLAVTPATCQVTAYFQVAYKGVLPKVVEHALTDGRLTCLVDLRDVLRSEIISKSYPRTGPFTKHMQRDGEAQNAKPVTLRAILKLARVLSRWKAVGKEGEHGHPHAPPHAPSPGPAPGPAPGPGAPQALPPVRPPPSGSNLAAAGGGGAMAPTGGPRRAVSRAAVSPGLAAPLGPRSVSTPNLSETPAPGFGRPPRAPHGTLGTTSGPINALTKLPPATGATRSRYFAPPQRM
eukprot:tig00000383_g24700.t1